MLRASSNPGGSDANDLFGQLAALPARALDGAQRLLTQQPPPAWLTDELQNRLLLLVNHVLSQEPEAMRRLARHKTKRLQVDGGGVGLCWEISGVGLFMRADTTRLVEPDLRVAVIETQWAALLKTVASGAQPEVKIFGDVLLAAEIGWIRDHVRWDIEADVARVIGDVPAVSLTRIVKGVIATVQQFSKRASA